MNIANLAAAIDNALPLVPPLEAPEGWLLVANQVSKAINGSPTADSRVVELIQVLRAEPDIAQFDGYIQITSGGPIGVRFDRFVSWLLTRSRDVGVVDALDGLRRYVEADSLDISHIFAMGGIQVRESCQLTSKLKLIPWEAVPDTKPKGVPEP